MHRNDALAILTCVAGLGSFAGSIATVVTHQSVALTVALAAFGAAGQTASQLLRIYGAPSASSSTPKGF